MSQGTHPKDGLHVAGILQHCAGKKPEQLRAAWKALLGLLTALGVAEAGESSPEIGPVIRNPCKADDKDVACRAK